MLTQMDRLAVYSVLCFITFCSLVIRSPDQTSIFALAALVASALGLWFELTNSPELEEEEH
ncbi:MULTISPECIES: hypothetical protein [Photobacterium]|nr:MULTISPECIES: hypothetical protein [Photobacterium]